MAVVETFEVEGHIVDSLILAKVLDLILESGADYRMLDFEIGRTSTDPSRAAIEVTAADEGALARLAELLQVHGVNATGTNDAVLVEADIDGDAPSLRRPTILVGPEGGWAPDEAETPLPRVRLAAHVLRAETAAITVGALLGALRVALVEEGTRSGHDV